MEKVLAREETRILRCRARRATAALLLVAPAPVPALTQGQARVRTTEASVARRAERVTAMATRIELDPEHHLLACTGTLSMISPAACNAAVWLVVGSLVRQVGVIPRAVLHLVVCHGFRVPLAIPSGLPHEYSIPPFHILLSSKR